jgi:hypothetical protein
MQRRKVSGINATFPDGFNLAKSGIRPRLREKGEGMMSDTHAETTLEGVHAGRPMVQVFLKTGTVARRSDEVALVVRILRARFWWYRRAGKLPCRWGDRRSDKVSVLANHVEDREGGVSYCSTRWRQDRRGYGRERAQRAGLVGLAMQPREAMAVGAQHAR